MINNQYTRLILVILLVVAFSEVAPRLVNAVLILILVGIVLSHWPTFAALAGDLSKVAG